MANFAIKLPFYLLALSTIYWLLSVLLEVIPSQDPDLIYAKGQLVTVDNLKQVFGWPVASVKKTKWPYDTLRVWNVD